MMARKQALLVTDAAAERIQALLAKRGKPSVGIRIGVRSRGCSGLSYTVEYADEKGRFDEIVEDKGVTILVDPKAVMFILGTEMDYVEEKLQSGFVFRNPNEKDRKSTRLNSSHANISYAVFCLKKKKRITHQRTYNESTYISQHVCTRR